jgi:hypothetical protein
VPENQHRPVSKIQKLLQAFHQDASMSVGQFSDYIIGHQTNSSSRLFCFALFYSIIVDDSINGLNDVANGFVFKININKTETMRLKDMAQDTRGSRTNHGSTENSYL